MQADFFTMEARPHAPPPTDWVAESLTSPHHQSVYSRCIISKMPIKTDVSENANVSKEANMIVAVLVSCVQPQRLHVSLILERRLIPHRHVP